MQEGEKGGEEAMIPLLSQEDFASRGISTDGEWLAFDALLLVAQVATEVLEEKINKKKEDGKHVEREKSLKKPVTGITDVSYQERLARERALKKPIKCPDDVSRQERLARERALKKHIMFLDAVSRQERLARERALKNAIMYPDDDSATKRYGKFKESEEEENGLEFKNKKTGLKRKYSDSEDDYEWGEEFKAKKSSNKIDKKNKSGSDKKEPKKNKASCSNRRPPMPEEMNERITGLNGTDLTFVIQKQLSKTDTSKGHNRVTIPSNQIVNPEFLTPEEVVFLDEQNGIPITNFVEPSHNISGDMALRQWDGRGKKNFSYVLKTGWNDVKRRNQLKENDIVQIWSFRVKGELCFAMFKVNEGVDSASGGQTSADNNNGCISSGSDRGASTDQSGVGVQGGSGCIGDGSGANTTSPSGEGEHNGSSSNASCDGSIGNGTGVGSSSQSPEGEHGGGTGSSNASGGGSDGSGDCVLTSQSSGDMGSTI